MNESIRHRLLLSAVALGTLVVPLGGCDSDSPTRPPRQAALQSRGALEFSCGLNCSYEGEAFNAGDSCATRVRGITRLLHPDGSELANDEWQLDPARRLGVGEAFLYGDCCFSLNDVNNMGSYRTELFWDAAPCG